MADAYSDAEKIIVNATGATGDALDSLGDSMLNAFAANDDSLEDTAAAVGEINTRMGLTGEELTEVTQDFMDFADVTSGTASNSVRNLTQLMNQWNVPAEEMSKLMDELTYAGQASGISVDTLSTQLTNNKAILDQLGFSLEEAIALFMNFELAGTNSTQVMTGFRTALANGDISSLEELYEVFEQIQSGAMSAAEASDMFGTRAGTAIVNAVNSGVMSIDELVTSLENSEGVMDKTAEAGESLSEKWQKATNSISTAFTKSVQPTLSKISAGIANVMTKVGDFLTEHPTITNAITAIGVGLGTAAVGIAGVAAAAAAATGPLAALATVIGAAAAPLTAVAAGVAAVTAAVLIFKGHYDDVYEEARSVTPVMAEQQEELSSLEAKYERACETYGATSKEASRLKYQIDDLSAEIDANGQSMDEWCADMDAVIQSHDDLMAELDSTNEELENSSLKNLSLIQKLEDLASQTDSTEESQQAMQAILSELNGTIDGLNVSYDDLTENTDAAIKSIREAAKAQAEQERQQALMDEYVDLIAQQADEQEALAEAADQVTAAEKQASEASHDLQQSWKGANGELSGWNMFWSFLSDEQAANDAAQDTLDNATTRAEELQSALDETDARIQEIEDEWAGVGDAAEGAAETTVTYEDACSTALNDVKDRVDELCASYDQAYQSALSSFEGQFGLFDEASTKSDEYLNASVENAQKALDSQLSYWETYNANLETLTSYGEGLTGEARENYETLLTYAQDGSEEAAGLAASMAEAISSGDEEAIQKLSETVGAVKEQQEEAAAATAEWQTNFNETLDGIVSDMSSRISEMGFEDEANQAALDTMTSYASGIKSGSNEAITEVEAVASQISAALEKSDVKAKIEAELDTSAVDKYELPEKTADAVYDVEDKAVEAYEAPDKEADAIYDVDDSAVRSYDPPDKTATVTYKVQTSGTVPGHATGTTYAENMFIAGEDGPELIVGQQGSTVFPHSETEQIIDAMSRQNETVTVVNEYEPTNFMDKLESAFSKLTNKMTAVFEKLGGIAPTVELEGYASGTTASEDSFIAGEDGPELIVGKPDSTVFPADETDKIVNAIGNSAISVGSAGQQDGGIFVPTGNDNGLMEDSGKDGESTRKILLEIAGKGNIESSGGKVDKETMLSFLYEYLKPVLSEILTQEIYEEGDLSCDF